MTEEILTPEQEKSNREWFTKGLHEGLRQAKTIGLAATPVATEVTQVRLTRWINYGSEGWNPFDEAAAITQDLGLGFETRLTIEKEDYDRLSEAYQSLKFGKAVPSAEPVAPVAPNARIADLLSENAALRNALEVAQGNWKRAEINADRWRTLAREYEYNEGFER